MTTAANTHLVIADDHPLFRDALRQAVASVVASAVISEAGSFDDLTALLERDSDVDLILLDLTMPGISGFSGLIYLRAQYPAIPVVIVSASDDAGTIRRSLDFGASGFIPKRFGVETLRDAIMKVMEGDVWVPPDTDLSSADDPDMTRLRDRLVTLTPQQVRVLMMLSEGLLNKQIAYELGVSEATIKAHVSAILQKLGVESRTQAVIAAAKIAGGQWRQGTPTAVTVVMSGSGKALLFDIDGTLADTDALHLEAFNQVLRAPWPCVRSRARLERVDGFFQYFDQRTVSAGPVAGASGAPSWRRRNKRSASSRRRQIKPLAGLMTLLAWRIALIPMVAVTNAPRLNAEMMLSGLDIMQRFKAIIIGDELAHGKPHPLPYLEGLRAVSAAPDVSRIRRFRSGVQSASAAGIATIGIRTSLGHGDLVCRGRGLTASAFDDPELVRLVGKTMNW